MSRANATNNGGNESQERPTLGADTTAALPWAASNRSWWLSPNGRERRKPFRESGESAFVYLLGSYPHASPRPACY